MAWPHRERFCGAIYVAVFLHMRFPSRNCGAILRRYPHLAKCNNSVNRAWCGLKIFRINLQICKGANPGFRSRVENPKVRGQSLFEVGSSGVDPKFPSLNSQSNHPGCMFQIMLTPETKNSWYRIRSESPMVQCDCFSVVHCAQRLSKCFRISSTGSSGLFGRRNESSGSFTG